MGVPHALLSRAQALTARRCARTPRTPRPFRPLPPPPGCARLGIGANPTARTNAVKSMALRLSGLRELDFNNKLSKKERLHVRALQDAHALHQNGVTTRSRKPGQIQ